MKNSIRDCKTNSDKLMEMLSENRDLKENNESLFKQNSAKQNRIIELENIIRNQEYSIQKLNENEAEIETVISDLKKEKAKILE